MATISDPMSDSTKTEIATLGAGCFWCVEAVFQELNGVASVVSGYMGGHVENPTYEQVCQANTGHAEVVQVTFDPSLVDFATILRVFWSTHDPTTLNRQGADRGPQYRSAVYYHSDKQLQIAQEVKLEAAALWDKPIVTEITEADTFYVGEAHHQDFYRSNPNYGYCTAVINPKMAKFRAQFAEYLK